MAFSLRGMELSQPDNEIVLIGWMLSTRGSAILCHRPERVNARERWSAII